MKALALTILFSEANIGLLAVMATYAINRKEEHEYLEYMLQQLTVDAPEDTRKMIGDDLADKLLAYYAEVNSHLDCKDSSYKLPEIDKSTIEKFSKI